MTGTGDPETRDPATPDPAGAGTLVGVGVGPGDPDLLTLRGRDALRHADEIVVPVAAAGPDEAPAAATTATGTALPGEPGYAERVVAAHVPDGPPVTRVPFALAPAHRDASWRRAAATVAQAVGAGRTVAFATLGDPAVYSTFTYLARHVRAQVPGVTVRTVPGITAMQELASRHGSALVEHDEPLTLLPVTAGLAQVRQALATGGTVVLYKGGRWSPQLRALLAEHGALDRAVYGARLGHPDEEIGGTVPDAPAPYLSTVIVRPAASADAAPEQAVPRQTVPSGQEEQ